MPPKISGSRVTYSDSEPMGKKAPARPGQGSRYSAPKIPARAGMKKFIAAVRKGEGK